MRLAIIALVALTGICGLGGIGRADDRALRPYVGQVVLSPDAPSASFNELPAFLKANFEKSAHYEVIRWDVNFVGVLAKPADKVTLVVSGDDNTELISIELASARQVVIGHFKPTKAAGFAVGKTYAVALVSLGSGKKLTVAKAELTLRE